MCRSSPASKSQRPACVPDTDTMHRLLAFCVLLMIATDGAHGHLLRRWQRRGQLPTPVHPAAAPAPISRDEALPESAVNEAWSKAADDIGNNVMYFAETKQELLVFGEVPTPIVAPGSVTNINAPATHNNTPNTAIVAPNTSTSAPATSSSAPDTTTIATVTSTPFTAPPGYTYSPVTGSYYKFHKEELYWPVANATCANEGSYLVILNDAEEAEVIGKMTRAADKWWTWTGLIDKRPEGVSEWRSIHGVPISTLYHNWFQNRPLNEVERIYALMNAGELKLSDVSNVYQMSFACEISP